MKIEAAYFVGEKHIVQIGIFGYALEDLSIKYKFDYYPIYLESWNVKLFDNIPTSDKNIVVFSYTDLGRSWDHIKEFKKRCPNSYVVELGGDIIYVEDRYNKDNGVDLYLDPNDSVIKHFTDREMATEKFHLSISRRFKHLCDAEPDCDKDNDILCLCRIGDGSRRWRTDFFNEAKKNFNFLVDVQIFTEKECIKLYKKSKFSLGTTSGATDDKGRSLKGFRDWIGPLCDSLLIYDDHPQIISDFGDIVPTHEYGNMSSLINLVEKLKNDTDLYNSYLIKQKEWIENNFTDNQLERIFKKREMI